MIEAVGVRVRYDTPDEKGEKRRDRNDKFGEASPVLRVPPSGRYLWDWYFDLSDSIRRVRDGVCEPIPPTEFLAWREASGNIVYPSEYAILRAMDGAYCSKMGEELAAYEARRADERVAAAEAARQAAKGKGR